MVGFNTDALEEDEIELSLGLSLGGSFKASKKSNPVEKEVVLSVDINTDLKEISGNFLSGSSVSPVRIGDVETDFKLDPQRKRELLALRRQEARKKREEKQKRGLCRGRNDEYGKCGFLGETKENEDGGAEAQVEIKRVCKREKVELDPSPAVITTSQPVVPMHVQCGPFPNGFSFPYVNPYWTPGPTTSIGTNVAQSPTACRSFRPFRRNGKCGLNLCGPEQNSGGSVKPLSSVSPGCSSSAISENRSNSLQGGGSSSDSGTHSSQSKSAKPQLYASIVSEAQGHCEYTASSHPLQSAQVIDKPTSYIGNTVPDQTKPNEEVVSKTQPDQNKIPISSTENQTSTTSKEIKDEIAEPEQENQAPSSLAQMPCVSTTGNGPNGKTITGFLYRYTKTEVSIICVCHGSSFSPAEFVEHAGGVDVSHPLRHITVVPSAF